MNKEVQKRIEKELAEGNAILCRCEACGSEQTDTYRPIEEPSSEVKTYCDECADELSEYIIPSTEYHSD